MKPITWLIAVFVIISTSVSITNISYASVIKYEPSFILSAQASEYWPALFHPAVLRYPAGSRKYVNFFKTACYTTVDDSKRKQQTMIAAEDYTKAMPF